MEIDTEAKNKANFFPAFKIRPLMDGNPLKLGLSLLFGIVFKIRPLMDGNLIYYFLVYSITRHFKIRPLMDGNTV